MRPMAKSGAISAMIYNRWGDLIFLIFMFMGGEIAIMFLGFAIICKSSIYIYQY